MHSLRRIGAGLGALSLLVLVSCADSAVTSPEVVHGPSFAIGDGTTGPDDDFYFLPPLADGNPNPAGEFNPFLLPTLRVCEIDEADLGLPAPGTEKVTCAGSNKIVVEAGSLPVTVDELNEQYQISWDTDGPETTRNINTNKFLLLEVLVGNEVQGWIDLDPQDPDGPGQSIFDAYPFRLGETIPVKFFLSTDVLCEPSAFVTECITGAFVDQEGGNLFMDGQGNRLGVLFSQSSLPDPFEEITVTIERIDAGIFLSVTGEECIPGIEGLGDGSSFDAPQFGDCFRVTTIPELTVPLTIPALVSICLDPSILDGIDLTQEQQDQLTMVRFDDGEWEALADAGGDCPISTTSLLDVPDRGFMRYAAMGINAIADFVGPEPLAARDIRLGGLTGSFSRFSYTLPGQTVITAGDGTVLQAGDDNTVQATVNVIDHEGVAVENAVVHYSTTDGWLDGTTSSTADVTTGADGNATVSWIVDRSSAGDKVLTASALGLLAGPVPEHDSSYPFTVESVDITVTVVGPPSALAANPAGNIDDAVAGEPESISVTVTDAFDNPVSGAIVTWTCTEQCVITPTSTSDENGVATAQWTPQTAGSQASAASIDALTADFTATVAPAAAAALNATQSATTGLIGSDIGLGIVVTDIFGNARAGDAVTWSVTGGGGSIDTFDATTAADGSAAASWTLGVVPGPNTASVGVGTLSATFAATGNCFDGWGIATVDGTFDPTEWDCAESQPFMANISGGNTDATVHWMNDGDNLYLAVRVLQSSLDKVNDVRFDFDNDGDGTPEVGDDAIGYNGEAMTFIDEFLTQRCLNRSQSGCGRSDSAVDGTGAVANDGMWTTFELSHPLSGTPGEDFSVIAGDVLGFFLTLQQGNGAQGNTQVPGFRSYLDITIVGPGS